MGEQKEAFNTSDAQVKHSEALFSEFMHQLEHNHLLNVKLCPVVKNDQEPVRCQMMMLLAASHYLRSIVTEDIIHKEDEDVTIIVPDTTSEDLSFFVRNLYHREDPVHHRHYLFDLFRIQNQDKFHHINFKKILKNEEIYENFHDICEHVFHERLVFFFTFRAS